MSAPTNAAAVLSPLEQELEWYFSYAEGALRLGRVALLPAHEATGLEPDSDAAVILRAQQLASTVQLTLATLSARHMGVLRAAYTPRRWPPAVTREFAGLSAIAVRLACATHPWPVRSGHDGLEQAVASHLARLLARNTLRTVLLRKRSQRLMRGALAAYERARTALPAAAAAPKSATA